VEYERREENGGHRIVCLAVLFLRLLGKDDISSQLVFATRCSGYQGALCII
jgi:hypothetical protein